MENNDQAVMYIKYGVVRQPESFNNIRVEITLPVFVQPGQSVLDKMDDHLKVVKERVQREVDDEFENHGYVPPYFQGQRFMFVRTVSDTVKLAAIFRDMPDRELPNGWHSAKTEFHSHTAEYIQKMLRKYREYTIYDVTDQNYAGLPYLNDYILFVNRDNDICILTEKDHELSQEYRQSYTGWWNTYHYTLPYMDLIEMLEAENTYKTFIDCTDEDWSKLPPPPEKNPPAPGDKDDYQDPDYDTEDDEDEDREY